MSSRSILATKEANKVFEIHNSGLGGICKPEQLVLDSISSLKHILEDPFFQLKSRKIKDHFIKREFNDIFTNPELLPVYAVEHVSSRALCYRDIFVKIKDLYQILEQGGRIVCLGAGNGAELLGIASAMYNTNGSIDLILQDLSNYQVTHDLLDAAVSNFKLENRLHLSLQISDLHLFSDFSVSLQSVVNAELVTACFILNEILSHSKKAFVTLITYLVKHLPSKSYFLVIDSAGSFSECAIGSENQNSYMLFTLLDQIKQFKKLESYDSVWYRVPQGLEYPLKLDNMRFFLRLYQKI